MYRKRAVRRFAKKVIRRPRRSYPKKGVSVGVKRYVTRALNRRIENKQIAGTQALSFGSILESPDMNAYPILPYTGFLTCPQGVTQGTRTGNECKIKRVMLNYVLLPQQYNVTTNPIPVPIHVQMFLGAVKQYKGILPQSADVNLMFQLGGSAVAPGGTLMDLTYQINKDNWDIKKAWSHKLGYAAYGGTGTVPSQQSFTNNDFKLNVVGRIDITKHCAAVMKFNDGNSTHQGANLFFMFQAISANGAATGATVQTAQIQYSVSIEYEDA